MKLTNKSHYAIKAMLDLAIHTKIKGTCVNLSDISYRQIISLPYLEEIFSNLRKAKLVYGIRGHNGGYKLSKLPNELSITEIIKAVEDPIYFVGCNSGNNQSVCLTNYLWLDLTEHIEQYFFKYTLADLIRKM